MKKNIHSYILLCILFCISYSGTASAQGFNSITTPDGVNLIAVGNSGKLYRSASSGTTWTSSTFGILNMNCVTSLGSDVWIAVNNGTVYKTQKTSSPINSYSVGSSNNLNSVFFTDANTGFVCGDLGSVYKTTDGGVTWFSSNIGITGSKLNSVWFKDAGNGTIVGNTGSIFITSNGGASWSLQTSGTIYNLLKVKYFNDSLVAVGEFGTILTNTGSGWTSKATRTRTDIRGLTGMNMNDVHVCGGGGFIRNNRNSSSNFMNFEKNPMMANLYDIFYYDNNNGWAVSSLNSVIIKTANGGSSWGMPTGSTVTYNWVSKPGASGNFLGDNLYQHPTDRNTVFLVFGGQVSVSRNRGESWSAVGTTIPAASTPHSFIVNPLDTNIWMVATEASPDKVYRSSNYGATWTQILAMNFSSYGQPLEIDQNNPHVYYFAPDNGGFWKSTDDGASFTQISTYPFRSPCEILVTWDSSNVIILGDGVTSSSAPAQMFRSINGGANWTLIDSTTSSETPSMCNSVFDKSLIWCTEWSGSNIYKSTNTGASFSLHHSTGFSGWGSDICREDPTMAITGSWGNAGTLTLDGGTTWTTISTGLSGHGGGILALERGFVLAQQGSNVYKLNIAYTDSPVTANIDVQALSIGAAGANYYPTPTIIPTGTVKNNNGVNTATFNVIRKITPGGYSSTKTVTNLGASSSTSVSFDPWTFNSGTLYTVKDSVYILDDANTSNDVISGSITPYVGETVAKMSEGFTGSYPPTNWTFNFSGTNYWIYNSVSSYGNGTGCSEYDFWNAATNTGRQWLLTPTFSTSTISGDSLVYDYAYASYTSGTDSLIIQTSTNGGTTYTVLAKLHGKNADTIGVGTSFKTAATTASQFSPAANQWLTKKFNLPVGTNKIAFIARSGFGNDLYLDSIRVITNNIFTQNNIKLAPEGLYNGTTLNLKDSVRVYLRNSVSPFNKIDSAVAVLDSATFTASCVFKYAASGIYYYQIIHRNALEEWSKTGGETFTKGVVAAYDFTSAQSQGYGNNLILKSGKWCLYSGDVNKDGSIDLTDLIGIFNDVSNFVTGYVVTDLNGDGTTDLTDIIIGFNNSAVFITKITPESSPADVSAAKNRIKQQMMDYNKKNSGNIPFQNNVKTGK